MDDINNLDDLKKVASNDVIMKCFTEFFMEIYGEYEYSNVLEPSIFSF